MESKVALFHNLINLAAADGVFTDQEVAFLASRAEAWGLHADEFETALAGISAGGVQIQLPDDHDLRVELLKEMIRMMAADGELADIEKQLCANASARMGFSTAEFIRLLDEVLLGQ
ncbi:MAG TPA: TerB family tellurite resistance protein [Pirellulaceae bacterium]|nr:TerB family tellurite resistance protein [Pirellulaceae bacterium]